MNPEFKRQLWLELDPGRVVVLAIVLGALFTLMGMLDARGIPGVAVPTVALVTFIAMTVAWGAHRAGESVLAELRERTWDTQRISALSPTEMGWGKLFGATSYAWLGGALCLAVFVLTASHLEATTIALIVLQAVGGAVLVHALSLIAALVQAGHPKLRKGLLGGNVAAVVLGLAYAKFASGLGVGGHLVWYGVTFDSFQFNTVLLLVTAAWAVFGVQRMMCHELQVATRPWAWAAFLGYLTLVAAGSTVGPGFGVMNMLRPITALGTELALVATYLCALTVFRDPLALRRLARYGRAEEWRRLLEAAPLWLVSLVLAAGFALLSTLLGPTPDSRPSFGEPLGLCALPLLLYGVRDVLLLLTVGYGLQAERAEISALIYLGVLDWLAPAILGLIGFDLAQTAVRPLPWQHPLVAALILLVHIGVIGRLAYQRYRARIAPP